MRGVPGSGKSFVVKQALELYPEAVVCSADDLRMVDGEYVFVASESAMIHAQNLCNFIMATCYAKDDVVIVDNTNIRWWEMENYIRVAKANGYKVIVYSCQPKTKSELKYCMKRQTHDVPEKTILALWFEMEHPTEWPDGAMNLVDKTVMTFNPTVDQIKNGLKL